MDSIILLGEGFYDRWISFEPEHAYNGTIRIRVYNFAPTVALKLLKLSQNLSHMYGQVL